ncbi:MAG: VanZ family protein, partial [Promethearchaeia archaeon]
MDAEEIQKWDKKDVLKMLPAILFAALIFYLSSLPSPVPTEAAEAIDFDINTILHIAEYAVLSFLLAFGLISKTENYNIIIIGVIYAFTDEIHQYFVPNRYFDIFDVIADCIGVLVGLIGYFILLALINRLELVL